VAATAVVLHRSADGQMRTPAADSGQAKAAKAPPPTSRELSALPRIHKDGRMLAISLDSSG
jgi:hypothetical protein